MAGPGRRVLRAGTASLVALVLVLALAGPASAHAQLLSSDPVQSSVLTASPGRVVLNFGEPVEIDFGSLRVLGPAGQRVDSGGTRHPAGDSHSVEIGLPADLPAGTYVVAWRVISADSHPVEGAFLFSIGTAQGAGAARRVASALTGAGGSVAVGLLFWLVRTLAFLALVLLVGVAALLALVPVPEVVTGRVRRVISLSWVTLLATSVLAVAVQGAYAAALPLSAMVRPSLFVEVLHTRFGQVEVLRVVILLALVPLRRVVAGPADSSRGRARLLLAGLLALGLMATPGLAGHAGTGSDIPLSMALDVLHLGGVSAWFGGLVVLVLVLLPGDADAGEAAPLAGAVSAWAFTGVVTVVASGVVQSVRQVGSGYALFHTTYGRTLLVKVGLVVLLVTLGAVSRSAVPSARSLTRPWRRRPGPAVPGLRRLRRSVLAELALALAVLGVTGLLVNAVPAAQAAAQPFSHSFQTLGIEVNVIVDPARAGTGNTVHCYVLNSLGASEAIPELDVSLSLPSARLGPLAVPLVVVGPGHYAAYGVDIPQGGSWVLTLTVRTSSFDEQEVVTTFPVH